MWSLSTSVAAGATRNAHNVERSPGGTSAGSAVAVAADMVALAHGVDGGGSIRLPAAWCRLVGYKPARAAGVRSRSNWHGLAVHGALAHSVRDAALLARLLVGDAPAAVAASPRARLRIAMTLAPPTPAPVAAPVRDAVLAIADALADLGHDVEPRDVFGRPRDGARAALAILASFLDGTREGAPRLEHPDRLQARTRTILRAAQLVPARALRAARRPEEAEQRRLADTLPGIDAILMPVSAQIAPRADDCDGLGAVRAFHRQGRLIPFTPPWNLVGWPAISLPAARDQHGVPIGIQLVAPPAAAATLLDLAAQLESTRAPSRAT